MRFKSGKDAPQCLSIDRSDECVEDPTISGVFAESKTGDCGIAGRSDLEATNDDGAEGARLSSLSDDALFHVLLYCGPVDVEEGLKLVDRRFHEATSLSTALWKEFCILTGKVAGAELDSTGTPTNLESLETLEEDNIGASAPDADSNRHRRHYFRNPCVPVDFSSIQEALKHCPRTPSSNSTKLLGVEANESMSRSSKQPSSVLLMPGAYDEQIRIRGEARAPAVAIRASFPDVGATIVSRREKDDDAAKDRPCILISTRDDDGDASEGAQKGIVVRLSHLRILHSSPGADIWGGNTAINVEGPRAQVVIESCFLQSDSGRGCVVTSQAVIELYRSTIVDCAATGFYLGDWGSRARISGSNIVRNGFGSKRLHSPSGAGNMPTQERRVSREQFEAVPPGHSGMYIESSMCWVDDSLIAGNCLTGLSVVRGGFVSLSASDITENGSSAIQIEDAHDLRDRDRLRGTSIRGGVVEGPIKNNFTRISQSDGEKNLFGGGVVRKGAPFVCDALEG